MHRQGHFRGCLCRIHQGADGLENRPYSRGPAPRRSRQIRDQRITLETGVPFQRHSKVCPNPRAAASEAGGLPENTVTWFRGFQQGLASWADPVPPKLVSDMTRVTPLSAGGGDVSSHKKSQVTTFPSAVAAMRWVKAVAIETGWRAREGRRDLLRVTQSRGWCHPSARCHHVACADEISTGSRSSARTLAKFGLGLPVSGHRSVRVKDRR